jgi:tRNA G18 (ribose-2'-O)-methylase SpoU
MTEFLHQRHKPLARLDRPRELVLVCAPLRSNVNLSRIVRVASCSGVTHLIACGNPKIDPEISRVDQQQLKVELRRSLSPVLKKLKSDGYRLVGLEQTTNSHNMHEYTFVRRTALVIGNERRGLTEDVLEILDETVEIPVYGLPFSLNVATATSMALFEYCRQFPRG